MPAPFTLSIAPTPADIDELGHVNNAAWVRWICRNISGTRREVIFNGSGLEILWRTIVLGIGCAFLIPIPWVLRWYNRWFVSQFELVERAA